MLNFAASGNWISAGSHGLLIAAVVTLAFAAVARLIRGVSRSGAVAGAIVAFVLYVTLGAGAFVALVSVFVLAWLTTRFGYSRKEQRGTAEKSDGRNAAQVFANLGVAAIAALLYGYFGSGTFILAAIAALGEAAADTVSSEYGQARNETAVLITNLQEVPAGTDGGITWTGTLAGIFAALIISLVCVAVRLLPWRLFWIPTVAAVLGMVVDSLLGACLERKNFLNNNAVNFLSTLSAASTAGMLLRSFA